MSLKKLKPILPNQLINFRIKKEKLTKSKKAYLDVKISLIKHWITKFKDNFNQI